MITAVHSPGGINNEAVAAHVMLFWLVNHSVRRLFTETTTNHAYIALRLRLAALAADHLVERVAEVGQLAHGAALVSFALVLDLLQHLAHK